MTCKHYVWIAVTLTLLTPTLAGLESYPEPFVQNGVFNAKLVVGKQAATSDVIGAVDIAASLIAESETDVSLGRTSALLDSHIGVLDVNAPELGSEPMIVVGGPCANVVAAQLMGYPQPCGKDFSVGKAKINYYPQDQALLVAGYTAQDTLAASYVLADHEDYNLTGNRSEVLLAQQDVLDVHPTE